MFIKVYMHPNTMFILYITDNNKTYRKGYYNINAYLSC